ncbi:NADH:flavin oxidoreductase/NADH oxidase [Astrocystis sublimbata]|nr:NADH:flavin oxidoreductase/NADH oxidase [Astrocystis sublimbata]
MATTRFPGPDVDPSPLGQRLHFDFSGKTAPNRFLKAAMSERLASWDGKDLTKRGIPSKELINVYRRWGEGALGLILTGNVMLYPDELEAPGNPIIPGDTPFSGERFEGFKELATQAKAHGSLIVAQVSHPGRQVPESIQPHPVSASDVQLEGAVLGLTFAKPRALEKSGIKEIVDRFAHAAEFLHKAGYDGIELHGAHGYLLAQFLAQTTNKRTDEYGGSLLNRARIIFEVVDKIRKRVQDDSFIIGIKLNSVEFQSGGFTPEECRDLCVELEKHKMDFVELSGGTYQELAWSHKKESSRKREAFFLEFADMIVPQLKHTKVYVVGGLRTAGAMVEALKTVHGIGLARPVTHEFDLAKKILSGKAKGAIDCGIDDSDFGISNVAAGTQMRLVGKDKAPLKMNTPEHKEAFLKSLQQFMAGMADNADGSKYGFVDINGVKLEPYGTPYAAAL